MRQVVGNIWSFYEQGHYIGITTNGVIKSNGDLVMGAGIALQATIRSPGLARVWAENVRRYGNHVYLSEERKLIQFPTKDNWRDNSKIELIVQSCKELMALLAIHPEIETVYLPRPGCGHGGLKWEDVRPVIAKELDNRIIIVNLRGD